MLHAPPMFAVIHLPQFALQAALRPEPELWTRPVALVDPALSTPRVCDQTMPALQHGIEAGLTPTQALARCREVMIRHRSPARESAATDALLQCAYGFSPNVENTAPGVATLDLRGLSELTPGAGAPAPSTVDGRREAGRAEPEAGGRGGSGMERWAGRLHAALQALQLTARIGIGPTPTLARHAARWGPTHTEAQAPAAHCSVVTDARGFVEALPVAALEPSTDVASILDKWGVRTVGQLLALGQEAVMDRLGLEAIALFAAASTRATRPLNLVRPTERYEESFEFEHAIETVEPLLFILNRFVDQLSRRLELGALAAEQLTLRLHLATGETLEFPRRVPQPTRRAEILFRMLQTLLDSLRTDAPIVGVMLRADPTRPGQKQFSLFEAALRDPHQFQETLARLSALVGAERVGTPVRENSHRPDAFRLVPPDFENAPVTLRRRVAEILRPTPMRRLRPAPMATVEVTAEGGAPGVGHGRQESGTRGELSGDAGREPVPVALNCPVARGRITMALGPWRASGHWWEETGAWARDEWDVQLADGPVLRLVRSREGWQVEALLD